MTGSTKFGAEPHGIVARDLPFPATTNAAQPRYGGGSDDAFVIKLSPSGTIAYSSFLGGSGFDAGTAVALGSAAGRM